MGWKMGWVYEELEKIEKYTLPSQIIKRTRDTDHTRNKSKISFKLDSIINEYLLLHKNILIKNLINDWFNWDFLINSSRSFELLKM